MAVERAQFQVTMDYEGKVWWVGESENVSEKNFGMREGRCMVEKLPILFSERGKGGLLLKRVQDGVAF